MSETRELRIGSRVAARYEVLSCLGTGGIGIVYEVIDHETSEPIALKTLRRADTDPQLIRREFRALADVTHPNLVQLYDLFDDAGTLCMTMELVRGTDLMTELRGEASPEPTLAATLPDGYTTADAIRDGVGAWPQGDARGALSRVRERFAQLVRGVHAVHRHGLVHRDIKPHNVRVTPEGRVVLLDFGLARVAGNASGFAGTLAYMAPEQADAAPVGPAADLYSVGALLHEVLVGAPPWTGTPHEVLRKKRMEDVPALDARFEDLGVLVGALLQRDPAARPSVDEVLEYLGQRRSERRSGERQEAELGLVGRYAERARLFDAWRGVVAGSSAWIAIEGTSGLGKTALMSTFARETSGKVLYGRCYERESVAYKGVDQIVESIVEELAAQAVTCRDAIDLAPAFPSVQQIVPPFADTIPPARIGHDRRGASLRALIERLALTTPVLIALDDIQWADRDCLALLGHALAAPGIPNVMVVVTARPEATARWQELPMPFERIRLGHLDRDEAIELATHLTRGTQIDPVDLARRSNGHPLELAELARATSTTRGARDLLVARVVDAPPEVRLLVEMVVTAGAPIPAAALGREDTVRAAIDRAQLAGLVRSRREGRIVVEPAHDQIREVLFAALSPFERARYAAALAPALEGLGHEPAHVAELYVLAGQPADARRCAASAATRMATLGGHDAAAALWRMVANLSDGDERRVAERNLADALTHAGRGMEAAPIYRALGELRRAAEELLRGGRIEEGLALIEQGLVAWKPPRGETMTLARALVLHGATRLGYWPRARVTNAREQLELGWAAIAGYTLGSPGHFLYAAEQHLRLALASGDAEHIALAWAAQGTLGTFMGDAKFADTCLRRASRALRDTDATRPRAVTTATAALIQLTAGAWARAEAVCAEAAELFDLTPNLVWERNTSSVVATCARMFRGELVALARDVRRERDRIAASGDLYAYEIAHTGYTAIADILTDDVAAASARLESFGTRPTGIMTAWQRTLAHGLLGAYGDRPAWHAERVTALVEGPLAMPIMRSPLVRGTILWMRATLDLACGRNASASIDRLRKLGARFTSALAELLAGHAALLAGDRELARARGAAAELALQADDMPLFAASARWLVDPSTWPEWRDALAKSGVVRPERFVRVFAPAYTAE